MCNFFKEDGSHNWWVLVPTMIIVLAGIIFVAYIAFESWFCQSKYDEIKERRRFTEDSIARVRDSLAHDAHYLDSVGRIDDIKESHTMVVVGEWSDSTKNFYHQSTRCWNILNYRIDSLGILGTHDIEKYRIISQLQARSIGYVRCKECYHYIYSESEE